MAASVVETVDLALVADTSGLTWTGTFATTPQADDVIAVLMQGQNGLDIASVTGCGAVWSQSYVRNFTGASGTAQAVWKGVTPSAPGDITITLTTFRDSVFRAFLLRGTDTSVVGAATEGSTASLAGPIQPAGPGQVVLGMGGGWAPISAYPASPAPAEGWVAQSATSSRTYFYASTAYRVPSETANHQTSVALSDVDHTSVLQAVVGASDTTGVLLVTADISHAAYTNTKAALEGAGHTVAGCLDTQAALDAADLSSIDVIVVVRAVNNTTTQGWLAARWQQGTPIFVGGVDSTAANGESGNLSTALGLTSDTTTRSSIYDGGTNDVSATQHPVTEGLPASFAVEGGKTFFTFANQSAGIRLATTYMSGLGVRGDILSVVEPDDALLTTSMAPARAVTLGRLYAGQYDYTTDGKKLLDQAVRWLATTPAPTAEATLTTGVQVGLEFEAEVVEQPPAGKHILLIATSTTSAGATGIRDALQNKGHTVTLCAEAAVGDVDLSDIDLIAAAGYSWVTMDDPGGLQEWLSARWAEGWPLLLGGNNGNNTYSSYAPITNGLGLTGSGSTYASSYDAPSSSTLTVSLAHPITAGYAVGSQVVVKPANTAFATSPRWSGSRLTAPAGTSFPDRAYLSYVESGDALSEGAYSLGMAPGRAVFCGWLFGAVPSGSTYTSDGEIILDQAVRWLTETPASPVSEATLSTPLDVGLDFFISQPVLSVTLDTPLDLGIEFAATAPPPVLTASLDTAVDLGLEFTTVGPPPVKSATLATPLDLALEFRASYPARGKMYVWDGATWVDKPLKAWDGTQWVDGPLTVWDGRAWRG